MAMVWVIFSFLFMFKLLKYPIPEGNKDVVIAAAGFVLGSLGTIVSYYFGQSKTDVDREKKGSNENI